MTPMIQPLHFHWIPVLKIYLLLRPTLLFAFLAAYPVVAFGPWARSINVSGQVIDPETDNPVPHSKVVISAWNFVVGAYDSSPKKFLITADDNGYFHFAREVDFLISTLSVEACAPDGRYAAAASIWSVDPFFTYKGSRRKGRDRYFYFPGKGYFRLDVYELPIDDHKSPWYHYDSFAGGLGRDPEPVRQ